MKNTIHDPVVLNEFVDRLVQEKGIAEQDEEINNQIKEDLKSRIEDRVNAAIVAHLPPEKLTEFERVLREETAEQAKKFCEAHIPNLMDVMAEAMLGFRQTYLAR